jgi:hypothetical protein
MNDPELVKRIVEQARQQAAKDHEPAHREPSPDARSRSRAAAAELIKTLPGLLTNISMSSAGAIHWASEPMSSGGTEFQLKWGDPEPARTLSLVVEDAGIVLWGWFAEWLRPKYNQMDAGGLSHDFLLSLVEALGDQIAWQSKREPDVRFYTPER